MNEICQACDCFFLTIIMSNLNILWTGNFVYISKNVV